jgi:hypothetical protein
MFEFLAGASVLASAAVALFFLRFWRDTGDRLFLIFALAFAVFAVNRILLSALDDESEAQTPSTWRARSPSDSSHWGSPTRTGRSSPVGCAGRRDAGRPPAPVASRHA